MKKVIVVLSIFLLTITQTFAINWQQVSNKNQILGYIDTDSIKEYEGYYFYNIKYQNNNQTYIITMQSSKFKPFSKKLKISNEEEYNNANGNYSNITNNMTKKLEPVMFDSFVYHCYKKVKEIKSVNNEIKIIQKAG